MHTYIHIHIYTCLSACMRAPMCLCVSLWMYTHTHTHACTLCICMHAYKHLRIAMFRLDHTIPFNQSVADIFHLGNTLKKQQHTNTSHLHIQSQELYTIRSVCVCIYKYVSTLGHTKVCTYVVQYTYDTKSRQPYTHAHIRIHIHS